MKIALINASPKRGSSASAALLSALRESLSGADVVSIELHTPVVGEEALSTLQSVDRIVFSFPVYLDVLPAHLLSCLIALEHAAFQPSVRVYALANCGFYESSQTDNALCVIKNWTMRAGLFYGGGVGIGGGGAIQTVLRTKRGNRLRAPIDEALEYLAFWMLQKNESDIPYETVRWDDSVGMPRFFYKIAAEYAWRQVIKKNGGKPRDLSRRL